MISVCLRFDDPSPASDHALERRIIEVLQARGVSVCFAVVPYSVNASGELVGWDPDLAAHLIEAEKNGLIEIALHGYTHQSISKTRKDTPSEFFGVSLDEQRNRVHKGLGHLRTVFGNVIKGFVPPWNSYDSNTVKVVNEKQIGFLSAGFEPYYDDVLPIIPRTCTLRNAEKEIELALSYPGLDSIVSIVFHPDEFEEFHLPPEDDEPPPYLSINSFDNFLGKLVSNPQLRLTTLSTLAEELRSNPQKISTVERWSALRYLPWRLKRYFPLRLHVLGSSWRQLPRLLMAILRAAR